MLLVLLEMMTTEEAHGFIRSGGTWTYQAKLLPPDGAANNEFGSSVAIYGDSIVVGADGIGYHSGSGRVCDENGRHSGSAHVFVRSGEKWTHKIKLMAPDGVPNDWFGGSVTIFWDSIVVGAELDDDNGVDSGSAHVFVV